MAWRTITSLLPTRRLSRWSVSFDRCPSFYLLHRQSPLLSACLPSHPSYNVIEERRYERETRLPCCGIGMGWFLFMAGFVLGGVPWYVGTLVLLITHVDYREKPGYVACTIASILAIIAVSLGVTKGTHNNW